MVLKILELVAGSTPLLMCSALLQIYAGNEMNKKVTYLTETFGGGNPPDLWFGIEPKRLYDYFAGIGAQGRLAYLQEVNWDIMPTMPAYTILLGSLLYRECKRANLPIEISYIFPITMICDAVETLTCGYAAKLFPKRLKMVYLDLGSFANQTKWVSLVLGMVFLSLLFLKNAIYPVKEIVSEAEKPETEPEPKPEPSKKTKKATKTKKGKTNKKKSS